MGGVEREISRIIGRYVIVAKFLKFTIHPSRGLSTIRMTFADDLLVFGSNYFLILSDVYP